ncbi:hypothetical protein PCASD_04627 [Puccinia coronata f. sp. avenae]|nr:hypothetical protein PCASD_14662 [Puccinia coronata f. sp. avenae]PLW42446.1 hypothetical protein PCASD_04627 [Puccinia coronata f. sp. avenae]
MFTLPQFVTLSVMFSLVAAGVPPPKPSQSFPQVQGTYWNGATFAGSCLLQNYYGSSPPEGLEYVSVAKDLNGGAAYCGACVKVTPLQGKRPPVMAVVSSVCMDCPAAALDMPGGLYDRLMGSSPGRPGIGKFKWQVVACPTPGRLPKVTNKSGSSKWSLSMLIVDTRYPIQSVVIRSGTQTFNARQRDYNHWELVDGKFPLADTVDVTVTCTNTRSFTVKNVDPSSMKPYPATSGC